MSLLIHNTEIAVESLISRKLRTGLSILGIIIGVAAVIIVGSISVSGKKIILDELMTFGLRSAWIWADHKGSLGENKKLGSGILSGDAEAVLRECPSVSLVTPVISNIGVTAWNGNQKKRVKLYSVNDAYTIINNDKIAIGRPLMPNDIRYKNQVCLIGDEVKTRLFQYQSPIGQSIKINHQWFEVVGVLEKKDRSFINSIGGASRDFVNGRVIIPISVYQAHLNSRAVDYLHIQAKTVSLAKSASRETISVLERRHRNHFRYKSETMQEYVEITEKIMHTVSWVGGVAAVISLIVGGIGIMNIMTATVVERTREIGIRKAIGASKKDILWQFMMESVWISLSGGVIGTFTGIVIIAVIEQVSKSPVDVSWLFILFSVLVSFTVGLVSGIYPAMRAASMDPVDALRIE